MEALLDHKGTILRTPTEILFFSNPIPVSSQLQQTPFLHPEGVSSQEPPLLEYKSNSQIFFQ